VTSQMKAAQLKVEELRPAVLKTSPRTDTTTADQPIRDEARRTYAEVLRRSLRGTKPA
jgi:hypothetical protein